jgi:branched-chain amino acid transport system permease protein
VLRSVLRRLSPAVNLTAFVLVFVLAVSALGEPSLDRFLVETLIYVVAVVGMQIFIGNSGIISFGHTAFMLVAAYATAWLTCCPGLKPMFMSGLPPFLMEANVPTFPAALLAATLATVFALVSGSVLMRLSGVAASIALFAQLAVMKSIYENWDSWTGGATAIIGLPLYVTTTVATAWAVVTIFVAVLFRESRFGLMLRASQDDMVAARASGVAIYRLRIMSLVVSAFFVGMSGVLLGHYLGTLSVRAFWLDTTFLTLAMLIIGGRMSVSGAVAGVLTVRILVEILRQLEQGITIGAITLGLPDGTQEVALAIGMVLFLVFRPTGLMRGREFGWPFNPVPKRTMGSTDGSN